MGFETMATIPSPDPMISDDDEHQQDSANEHSQDQAAHNSTPSTPSSSTHPGQPSKSSIPMQKRRRVTRACDECRRKKIKCDGALIENASYFKG